MSGDYAPTLATVAPPVPPVPVDFTTMLPDHALAEAFYDRISPGPVCGQRGLAYGADAGRRGSAYVVHHARLETHRAYRLLAVERACDVLTLTVRGSH